MKTSWSFHNSLTNSGLCVRHKVAGCIGRVNCAYRRNWFRSRNVSDDFLVYGFRRTSWHVRSSVDGGRFDPSSTGGRTRLIRAIQAFQNKLTTKIQEIRKDFPLKLIFFLAGFYCATAFSTVIGQTGDWDILSAALAVMVVEGIGAVMYKGSLPIVNEIRGLITIFNYWKAGLSLGLFLDSFKY